MRLRRIRILEIATVAAVLGIFVSLAVPSLLRIQARSRIDSLLESARSCRAELPGWVSNSTSGMPVDSTSESIGTKAVVTNERSSDGRTDNGILAVYDVEPGTK